MSKSFRCQLVGMSWRHLLERGRWPVVKIPVFIARTTGSRKPVTVTRRVTVLGKLLQLWWCPINMIWQVSLSCILLMVRVWSQIFPHLPLFSVEGTDQSILRKYFAPIRLPRIGTVAFFQLPKIGNWHEIDLKLARKNFSKVSYFSQIIFIDIFEVDYLWIFMNFYYKRNRFLSIQNL